MSVRPPTLGALPDQEVFDFLTFMLTPPAFDQFCERGVRNVIRVFRRLRGPFRGGQCDEEVGRGVPKAPQELALVLATAVGTIPCAA